LNREGIAKKNIPSSNYDFQILYETNFPLQTCQICEENVIPKLNSNLMIYFLRFYEGYFLPKVAGNQEGNTSSLTLYISFLFSIIIFPLANDLQGKESLTK